MRIIRIIVFYQHCETFPMPRHFYCFICVCVKFYVSRVRFDVRNISCLTSFQLNFYIVLEMRPTWDVWRYSTNESRLFISLNHIQYWNAQNFVAMKTRTFHNQKQKEIVWMVKTAVKKSLLNCLCRHPKFGKFLFWTHFCHDFLFCFYFLFCITNYLNANSRVLPLLYASVTRWWAWKREQSSKQWNKKLNWNVFQLQTQCNENCFDFHLA